MVFISLRAWSSSSLIALYFSFWVYSSSAWQWVVERKQVEENAEVCRPWREFRRGKKERSDQRLRIKKDRGWFETVHITTRIRGLNEPYLLSHLWSSPASSLSSLKIPHGFQPVVKKDKYTHHPDTTSLHLQQAWTHLLEPVIQDFNLLFIFVFFLRVLESQSNRGTILFHCQNN